MRVRITVNSPAVQVATDVVVECASDDRLGDVVDRITGELNLPVPVTIDGASINTVEPVAGSLLRAGATMLCGQPVLPECGQPWLRAQPAPPAAGLLLRVESGPDAGVELALTGPRAVVIGRAASADLVLTDPDVSAKHAIVSRSESRTEIVDAGSKNGVFVDGVRITQTAVVSGESRIQVGGTRLRLLEGAEQRAAVRPDGDGGWLVHRTGLLPRHWKAADVELPNPPEPEDEGRSRLQVTVLIGAPIVLGLGLALATGRLTYLGFVLVSPLILLANTWVERNRTKRRQRRRQEVYDRDVQAARFAMQASADDEDEHLRRQWPGPRTVLSAVHLPGILLWHRSPRNEGWLRIRLGTLDRPGAVTLRGSRKAEVEPPVIRRAPVGVDLTRHRVLGIAGDPASADPIVAWVMLQCAALHGPDELSLLVVGECAVEYGWLRWLPGSATAWTPESVEEAVQHLRGLLDAAGEEPRSAPVPVHTVVLLHGVSALPRWKAELERLLDRAPAAGVAFVCVERDRRNLSRHRTALLHAHPDGTAVLEAGGDTMKLTPDHVSLADAERAARALAPLWPDDADQATALPNVVRYFDLVDEPTIDSIRAAWRLQPATTRVAIGRDADGDVEVDLVCDGPHGLIAGMTGSGKSELVQTLLAGLALGNAPDQLNFLLVDYKGGATFLDLVALPHVVGVVTNLNETLAHRAIAAIRQELRRRQELLKGAQAESYEAYVRHRAAGAPLSRLLILVDEFYQLKRELPAAAGQFESVATIGRTLGVHLILATQNPSGVVPRQVESNVGLRICMRVANRAESVEAIGVADAAFVPRQQPGRGFVKKGNDQPRPVQVAWTGMRIRGAQASVVRLRPVRWYEHAVPVATDTAQDTGRTELEHAVRVVCEAATAERLTAPHRPWLPPLPPTVLLPELETRRHHITLGLQDIPAEPAQRPLHIPLGSGHLAIVGSLRSGRTTALRAIAVGLAAGGGVHLHVVDASRGLAKLGALAACGVVVRPDDERADRLLDRLELLVTERQAQLFRFGLGTLAEWWDRRPDSAPAHVVLLLDGVAGLGLGANATGGDHRRERLLRLLRTGISAGVTVVLATDESGLRGVSDLFIHATYLAIKRSDTVPGTEAKRVAALEPGRALWSADWTEVQIPLLVEDPTATAQNDALVRMAPSLPSTIDPSLLRLDELPLVEAYTSAVGRGAQRPAGFSALLGVGGDRLSPLWTPVSSGQSIVVIGPRRSGRTTALAAIARSLRESGARVVVVGNPAHPGLAGLDVVSKAELAQRLKDGGPDAVVIDDARTDAAYDTLPVGAGILVTAATGEDHDNFQDRLLRQAVERAVAKVVLGPPNHLYASGIKLRLARDEAFTGPPGRAIVEVDGEKTLVQLPDVTAD